MLSQRLIQLREEKFLTKKDVALYLKIDQSTYGKYELSKREPDFETLLKLADFFGVSVDFLLGRSDLRNSKEIKIEQKGYNLDVSGLPEEAVMHVREYIEFVKTKYTPSKNIKK